jgi:hypothetical protein
MKTFILAISIILACLQSSAGQAGKGGYYANSVTLNQLNFTKNMIAAGITGFSYEELNSIAAEFTTQKIDPYELARIVRDVKAAPLEQRTRKNSDGYQAPLELDYSIEEKEIIALREFFLFHSEKEKFTYADFKLMGKKLIHEASHIFGIGTENDNDSAKFAAILMEIIYENGYPSKCGATGSMEQKLEFCNEHFFKNSKSSVYISNATPKGFELISVGYSDSLAEVGVGQYSMIRSKKYPEILFARVLHVKVIGNGIPYRGKSEGNKIQNFCSAISPEYRVPNLAEAKMLKDKLNFNETIYFVTTDENQRRTFKTLNPKGQITSVGFWKNNVLYGTIVCLP